MARILVVDDVADNRKLLVYELEEQGHELIEAAGGCEALEMASARSPDIILLDVMMPGMDGIDVCRRLKDDDRTHVVPVILVSARGLDENVVAGLDAGADDYVAKPFNSDVLAARVRSALRVKESHDAVLRMSKQLIDASRRAGMADVATDVLHNVGNVLNSVNVSAGLISERLRDFGISDLSKATRIMEQHLDNLGNFVTQDERGKHLAPFLIDLSHQMTTDEEGILQEVQSLTKNVEHIRDIITLQQSHTGVSGLVEEASLAGLIEDAIHINSASPERHGIEITRDFEDVPIVAIDRQKLVQVFVNVISNAKYALIHSDRPEKRMSVRMHRLTEGQVQIDVEDNGIGIAEENLTRIFSHGFTTRKEGHGFGLHSASLAVKELGGELAASSEGPGKGALFSIVIPVQILKPVF